MKPYKNLWDKEPDFVNAEGTKWWKHPELTEYAHKENKHGVSLPTMQCWVTQTTDNDLRYVILNTKIGEIIYTSLYYDAICEHINIRKFLKHEMRND